MPIINTVIQGSGGGSAPDYDIKRAIDQNGKLVRDPAQTVFSTSPATDVGSYIYNTAFYDPTGNGDNVPIETINLDSLTDVSGESAFDGAWLTVETIQSFSANNLTTISGVAAFSSAFSSAGESVGYLANWVFSALQFVMADAVFANAWAANQNVESISFPQLNTVGYEVFRSVCESCVKLTTASFPSLTSVNSRSFASSFTNIDPVSEGFPAHTLTITFGGTDPIDFDGNVDCFEDMLDGTVIDVTINAPAASQSDIENMTGYPDFGCTGTVTWNWQS